MFVVAWLANYNGMASWCWEAAHALNEAGHPVILVCSDEVTLSGLPSIPIFRFTPPSSKVSPQRSLGRKILRYKVKNLHKMWSGSTRD